MSASYVDVSLFHTYSLLYPFLCPIISLPVRLLSPSLPHYLPHLLPPIGVLAMPSDTGSSEAHSGQLLVDSLGEQSLHCRDALPARGEGEGVGRTLMISANHTGLYIFR